MSGPFRQRLAAIALLLAGCRQAAPAVASSGSAAPEPALASPAPATGSALPVPPGGTAAPSPSAAGCADPLGCYASPVPLGDYDAGALPEVSGIAASRRYPGRWYLLDDGRQSSLSWWDEGRGAIGGVVRLAGFEGEDTEALAVAPCAAGAPDTCVFIGDVGDNDAERDGVRVARFAEPPLDSADVTVEPVVITLTHPTGAVDVEALLVDDSGVPHLVTKDVEQARLLAAPGFADGVLVDLGTVAVPEPAVPLASALLGVLVTAGDSRSGRVVLRTYDSAVEWVAPEPGSALASFPTWPSHEVPAPPEAQGEAIAYVADGTAYVTASEGVGDMWLMHRQP